jgi:glycosyltransferase involved in cell wall biosynthesis
MRDVRVSVAVITYNQEAYIETALESLLSQRCDFEFEIIIGDDASSDGTSSMCAEYARRYPGIITHIHREKNVGYVNNLLDVFRHCSGEFIAILEADDHWISDTKLAEQVEVFARNPGTSLCFTNSAIDDTQVPTSTQYFQRNGDEVYSYLDCLRHCVAPTSTFMFRRSSFVEPPWFRHLLFYEYFLIYLLADSGSIYYLNRITACRTQHYRGQSTTSINRDEGLLDEVVKFNDLLLSFTEAHRSEARPIVLERQIAAARQFIASGKVDYARRALMAIRIWPFGMDRRMLSVCRAYAKLRIKLILA